MHRDANKIACSITIRLIYIKFHNSKCTFIQEITNVDCTYAS